MTQTLVQITPGPWRHARAEYDRKNNQHPQWIETASGETVSEYAGCGSHFADYPNQVDFAACLLVPEMLDLLVSATQRMPDDEWRAKCKDIVEHLSAIPRGRGQEQ